ncbi:hypothetical protein [Leucobacter sp. GX24907]
MGVQVPPRAPNERCCNPGLKKQVLGYNIALFIASGALLCPSDGLLLGGLVEDRLERCCGVGVQLRVLVQVDAGEERLVREALVLVIAALVDSCEISCELEGTVDEVACTLIVIVVFSDLRFDAVEFGA